MTRPAPLAVCLALLASCATTPAPPPAERFPATLPDLTSYALIETDAGMGPPRRISLDRAADILATYDVIFVGEAHTNPGNHLAEMELFRALYRRAPALTLSMEQFERDVQPVVDDYLAGKIGEASLITKGRAWGNYDTSYRPLVEFAKEHHLPVIAANAPEKAVRCIGLDGLAFLGRMKPEQRAWVAASVHASDGRYRDKFMGFAMGDAAHGGDPDKKGDKTPSDAARRAFEAQVTRDDTMAESIYRHLMANPGRKVMHLNGSFHSDGFLGTVERLQARDPRLKIAVVSPTDTKGEVLLALKPSEAAAGTIVLVIRSLPEDYATEAEMKAAIARQVSARKESKCEL
ncbi:MAG: ChaN family lipoprotein [Candidatus Binataceae bacterium]